MLQNWRFDIFRPAHWHHAWNLWLSGWVIDAPKEWAFVLIIITFIPLWLTGWAAISLVPWEKLFLKIAFLPLAIVNKILSKPAKIISNTAHIKAVKKKKSYKEIRPQSVRSPIDDPITAGAPTLSTGKVITPAPKPTSKAAPYASKEEPATPAQFNHSLFQFDEDESFDFDFDAYDTDAAADNKKDEEIKQQPNSGNKEKNKNNNRDSNKNKNNAASGRENNKNSGNNPPRNSQASNQPRNNSSVLDVIKQKGYEVITAPSIKNTLFDFIGVAEKQICLCLIDKEPGDWLADEERFNDEEPLWFSESSHRISPVRKIDVAKRLLTEKLEDADMGYTVKAYVIEQIGNIINAEDMFEIWNDMEVSVTRIDRGSPKELKLFAKTLDDALDNVDKEKFDKVKKVIRSIA